MRSLITGANGFVGRALLERLLRWSAADHEIVAADIGFASTSPVRGVFYREGSLASAAFVAQLMDRPYDRIYHLATVAGVGARDDFDLGKATNLDATRMLLEAVRGAGHVPRFVYASSIGVFGPPSPKTLDDDTLPTPYTSYGTHKMIGELLVNDYSRAGFIDGLALRLAGVIARPRGSTTMLSAFFSDLFHAVAAGEPCDLPLAAADASLLMSLERTIDNLVHAGELAADAVPRRRYWSLPALLVPLGELVQQLESVYGAGSTKKVRFRPQLAVQAMFSQGPLSAAGATALGFRGDEDVGDFVRNVTASCPSLQQHGT